MCLIMGNAGPCFWISDEAVLDEGVGGGVAGGP